MHPPGAALARVLGDAAGGPSARRGSRGSSSSRGSSTPSSPRPPASAPPPPAPPPRPALVWFRGHDLRVHDQPALLAAARTRTPVLAVFVHEDVVRTPPAPPSAVAPPPSRPDPPASDLEQLSCYAATRGGGYSAAEAAACFPRVAGQPDDAPPRMGRAQCWYLHHSLKVLSRELAALGVPLAVRRGVPAVEVGELARRHGVENVFWTRREKPRPRKVEDRVEEALRACGVKCHAAQSEHIVHPDDVGPTFDHFHSYMLYWLERVRDEEPERPVRKLEPMDMPSTRVAPDSVEGTNVDDLGLLTPREAPGGCQPCSPRDGVCVHCHQATDMTTMSPGSFAFRDKSRRDPCLPLPHEAQHMFDVTEQQARLANHSRHAARDHASGGGGGDARAAEHTSAASEHTSASSDAIPPTPPRRTLRRTLSPPTYTAPVMTSDGDGSVWIDPAKIGCVAAADALRSFVTGPRFVNFADEDTRRDGMLLVDRQTTSRLSPHIRFGELSPRLVFHSVVEAGACASPDANDVALEAARAFLKNMCLRDFGYYMLCRHPDAASLPIVAEYNFFPWANDKNGALTTSWRTGTTGYPIIDAAMRQLAQEGWLHNRMRFLVASFFCRYLLLPWHIGASYLVYALVDGDEACNSLGWQWIAGCNSDSLPSTWVVNPVSTGANGVRDAADAAAYIRKYVPELAALPDHLLFEPWAATKCDLQYAGVELLDRADYSTAIAIALAKTTSASLAVSPAAALASKCYPMRIVDSRSARFRSKQAVTVMRRVFQSHKVRATIVEDSSLPANKGLRDIAKTHKRSVRRISGKENAADKTSKSRASSRRDSDGDEVMEVDVTGAVTGMDWAQHDDTHSAAESLSLLSGVPSSMTPEAHRHRGDHGARGSSRDGRKRASTLSIMSGRTLPADRASPSLQDVPRSETVTQSKSQPGMATAMPALPVPYSLPLAAGLGFSEEVVPQSSNPRPPKQQHPEPASVSGRPGSPENPVLEAREHPRLGKRPRTSTGSGSQSLPSLPQMLTPRLQEPSSHKSRLAVSQLLSPDVSPTAEGGHSHFQSPMIQRALGQCTPSSASQGGASGSTEGSRSGSQVRYSQDVSVRESPALGWKRSDPRTVSTAFMPAQDRGSSSTSPAGKPLGGASGSRPPNPVPTGLGRGGELMSLPIPLCPPQSKATSPQTIPVERLPNVNGIVRQSGGLSANSSRAGRRTHEPVIAAVSVPQPSMAAKHDRSSSLGSSHAMVPNPTNPTYASGQPQYRNAGPENGSSGRAHEEPPQQSPAVPFMTSGMAVRSAVSPPVGGVGYGSNVSVQTSQQLRHYPGQSTGVFDIQHGVAPGGRQDPAHFAQAARQQHDLHAHPKGVGYELPSEAYRGAHTVPALLPGRPHGGAGPARVPPPIQAHQRFSPQVAQSRPMMGSPTFSQPSLMAFGAPHATPTANIFAAAPFAPGYVVGNPYRLVPPGVPSVPYMPPVPGLAGYVPFQGAVTMSGQRHQDIAGPAGAPPGTPGMVPPMATPAGLRVVPGGVPFPGVAPLAPGSVDPNGGYWHGPSTRYEREEIARRMAAMDYKDAVFGGKHREQWQAIALHLLKEYEFTDETERQTSKDYVRLCVLKDELRSSSNSIRITVNHAKEVFRILNLDVTGEWDRRGHGGVRGPYVYGIRPLSERSQPRQPPQ